MHYTTRQVLKRAGGKQALQRLKLLVQNHPVSFSVTGHVHKCDWSPGGFSVQAWNLDILGNRWTREHIGDWVFWPQGHVYELGTLLSTRPVLAATDRPGQASSNRLFRLKAVDGTVYSITWFEIDMPWEPTKQVSAALSRRDATDDEHLERKLIVRAAAAMFEVRHRIPREGEADQKLLAAARKYLQLDDSEGALKPRSRTLVV